MAKYEAATEIFQGIGLNPALNIPFVEKFKAFDDPSTVGVPVNTSSKSIPSVSHVSVPFSKQPLDNFVSGGLNILYDGLISIGSPTQSLPIDVDTGSADLWLASDCPDCLVDEYDPNASSTYSDQNEDFSIAYVRQTAVLFQCD